MAPDGSGNILHPAWHHACVCRNNKKYMSRKEQKVDCIMDEGDIERLKQRMKELRTQSGSIKKELNALNKEKESWFSKRSELNKKISKLISTVKDSKEERNEITSQVQELKDKRDKLNKQISDKRGELKELYKGYDAVVKKLNIKGDPSSIKKRIEQIDYVMQTQPMSFEKEQKMMKELKDLKNQEKELGTVAEDWNKISELSKEISQFVKKSNKIHRDVKRIASSSQNKHKDVLSSSEEIDVLKEEENKAFEKFKEYKEKFKEKNKELKEVEKEMDNIREQFKKHNIEVEEDKKREQQREIKSRAAEVSEKIKGGKKLTTEDLLVYQKAGGMKDK